MEIIRPTERCSHRRARMVLLMLSMALLLTGCPVFYAWLYGEAELVITNNADTPVVALMIYLAADESLVREETDPIPVGESRTIHRLQRLEHRIDGLLERGESFSIVADLTDLDRITVEVETE